jgi:hypothetical protein
VREAAVPYTWRDDLSAMAVGRGAPGAALLARLLQGLAAADAGGPSRMNAALWVLQGLLAFAFFIVGALKVLRPKRKLTRDPKMRWAKGLSTAEIKLLGALQIVGALALVEPWATGIAPLLTPVAAVCFAVLMAGAVAMRLRRKERPVLPIALGVMSVIVAAMRFRALARGEGA